MIGAIKRRWKSKKCKVVEKSGELSSSSDTCPTSRPFDSLDDFDKILKPPSPRQVHPLLDDGNMKYSQLPPLPPSAARSRKSFTLPPTSEEGTAPFIHVNSGRIELVKRNLGVNSTHLPPVWRKPSHLLKANDSRHSWAGDHFKDVRGGICVVQEERGPPSGGQNGQDSLTLLLEPLRERLTRMELVTRGLEGDEKDEKGQYQRTLEQLARQVSRAMALNHTINSEMQTLHTRLRHLENNNKAMATLILPTLLKLQETVREIPSSPSSSMKTRREKLEQGSAAQILLTNEMSASKSLESAQRFPSSKQSAHVNKIGTNLKQGKVGECRIPRINKGRSSGKEVEKSAPTANNNNNKTSNLNNNNLKSECNNNKSTKNWSNKEEASLVGRSSPTKRFSPRPIPPSSSPVNHINSKSPGSVAHLPQNIVTIVSKLPVRKPLCSAIPTKHPAATSQSLPNQPNHSPLKTPSYTNNSKLNFAIVSKSLKISSASPSTTTGHNLHETKPLQKLSSPAPTTKAKDEGYSTMSSEALAEQEAGGGLKETKKPTTSQGLHKSNTFNTLKEIVASSSNGSRDNTFIISPSSRNEEFRKGRKDGNVPQGVSVLERKVATASVLEPTSITRTLENVRFVTGSPYEIQFSSEFRTEDDPSWDEQETSSSTILWEDSDDSDILFLPVSCSEDSGSQSTLIPHSSERSSSYTSWTSASGRSEPLKPYPLRRSKGEDFTNAHSNKGSGDGNLLIITTNDDGSEERALIEKWMRLEDVRNEVQWEEEWAWDWDGVARTSNNNPHTNNNNKGQRSTFTPGAQPVHLINDYQEIEEFSFASAADEKREESLRSLEKTVSGCSGLAPLLLIKSHPTFSAKQSGKDPLEGPSTLVQIDSSTWTKSGGNKMRKALVQQDTPLTLLTTPNQISFNINDNNLLVDVKRRDEEEEEASPPTIQFTPDFYRLTNYGSNFSFSENDVPTSKFLPSSPAKKSNSIKTPHQSQTTDDKVSQTDFQSSLDNLSVSSDLFTECRNCLEIIKSLVGQTGIESDNSIGDEGAAGISNSKRLSQFERRMAEMKADAGCHTAWLSLSHPLPSNETDRMLEILSSSESEDVPSSPSK